MKIPRASSFSCRFFHTNAKNEFGINRPGMLPSFLVSKKLCPSISSPTALPTKHAFTTTTTGNSSSSNNNNNNGNSPSSWKEAALQATEYLSAARSIIFVTGAGISAESGLPTYRGVSGLYNKNNGRTEEGYSIEECLSGSMYRYNPSITWKYLLQIERSCRGVQPSKAHMLVAATERNILGQGSNNGKTDHNVTVITQNIDELHTRAGSTDVIALHGELYKLYCTHCHTEEIVDNFSNFEKENIFPPKCSVCNKQGIRPRVVLFDEFLGNETIEKYENRLGNSMDQLIYSVMGGRDRFFLSSSIMPTYDVAVCIGTSAVFPYVNAAALRGGTKSIEINPTQTSLSGLVDVYIPANATETLEFIFDQLNWES